MANLKPKTGWRWLMEQAATFDMAMAGFTALVGGTSAINYWLQGHHKLTWTIVVGTVGVLVLSITKNAVTLREIRKKASMHELEGCLFTLLATLDPGALTTPGRVRLAVHVPDDSGMLEQVTEYIGDIPKKGRVGRKFSANAGIIGQAYREGGDDPELVLVAQRVNDDYDVYIRELVQDWSYTRDQALLLKKDVMTWMARPFRDPDTAKVEAVLYLDSTERDFFLTGDRQELVIRAATGIAVFIGKRYTN